MIFREKKFRANNLIARIKHFRFPFVDIKLHH